MYLLYYWSMSNLSKIRHGRHCVFKIHVHLVFVTKYRKSIFDRDALSTLEKVFSDVCKSFDAELTDFNGEREHVHLLINYPPKVSLSKLVNSLKGVSSRLLKKEHPRLSEMYYKCKLWSPSYFAASCGGAHLSIIQEYIENQQAPD